MRIAVWPATIITHGMVIITLVAGTALTMGYGVSPLSADTVRAVDFKSHGAPVDRAMPRGTVVAENTEGRPLILAWTQAANASPLVVVDAETGESETFNHDTGRDGASTHFLSSANHYYTYVNSHLLVFDVDEGDWLAIERGPGSRGRSFVEADDGTVYLALHPNANLLEFDPHTRTLRDHGQLTEADTAMYPQHLAMDEAGWIYAGITASHIVAFDPETGQMHEMIPEHRRKDRFQADVFEGMDGYVYGRANRGGTWERFYAGEAETLSKRRPNVPQRPVIERRMWTGREFREFPDGRRHLEEIRVTGRTATIIDTEDLARLGQATTWEYASRHSNPERAADGDPGSYAGVATSADHNLDVPKDIGVEWYNPRTFERVIVTYTSTSRRPTEAGHELQAWKNGQWQSIDAEVSIEDGLTWDYRLAEPVTAQQMRVLVTELEEFQINVQRLSVYEQYDSDRSSDSDDKVKTSRITFDYDVPGARIATLEVGPDGKIYGQSSRPNFIFRYDPETEEAETLGAEYGQFGRWNDMAVQGGMLFGGRYSQGELDMYDPQQPWEPGVNPKTVAEGTNEQAMIARPYVVKAHPDGRRVIMGGYYDWRDTAGGGLIIYDMETDETVKRSKHDLLVGHSTMALAALPDGNLLGGTTVSTRGRAEQKANEAKLYVLDMNTYEILHEEVPFEGVSAVRDLKRGPDERVYGLVNDGDEAIFFAFDPEAQRVSDYQRIRDYGRAAGGQAPRNLVLGPDEQFYVLFREGAIVQIDPQTMRHRKIGSAMEEIRGEPTLVGDRIYFVHFEDLWSELWSFRIDGME